jgi:hypothetical protein
MSLLFKVLEFVRSLGRMVASMENERIARREKANGSLHGGKDPLFDQTIVDSFEVKQLGIYAAYWMLGTS